MVIFFFILILVSRRSHDCRRPGRRSDTFSEKETDLLIMIICNSYHKEYLYTDKKPLPFGLNVAAYTFTKIMKPVVSYLRSSGLVSAVYLDNSLLLGTSFEPCQENTKITCHLLQKLGFIINEESWKIIPLTRKKYLGLIYDSQKILVDIPVQKQNKVIV